MDNPPQFFRKMTFYEKMAIVCRRIPRGTVATYGQIALLCGAPTHARQVGEGVEVLWTEDGWKVDLKKFGWKNTMEEAEAIAQKLQMCYTDGAEGGKDTTPEGK